MCRNIASAVEAEWLPLRVLSVQRQVAQSEGERAWEDSSDHRALSTERTGQASQGPQDRMAAEMAWLPWEKQA